MFSPAGPGMTFAVNRTVLQVKPSTAVTPDVDGTHGAFCSLPRTRGSEGDETMVTTHSRTGAQAARGPIGMGGRPAEGKPWQAPKGAPAEGP